ncbi:MAG: FAD-dependent oxidoreductase [Woeseiaceae bacterium]|nr:FAD-dependent oxidoreductase [Woeseiaceae bacterium]
MTDSILIVGGGVAGLHAAMECANAGARVHLVEEGPVVGGKLAAAMIKSSAIGDRAEGEGVPLLEALDKNERIEILTLSNLDRVEGGPGNFDVAIRQRGRFVTDACTRCKLCHKVCPAVSANEYDAGLTYRKAIYTPLPDTLPPEYTIDIDSCLNTPPNYLPCQQCVEVCEDDAIHFDLPVETLLERHVGAIILAPGFQVEDGASHADLGYGSHADIVTSAELQRLLESPGPTGGYASKLSNEDYPDSILFVMDNPSQFALYIVASQVHQLLEQDVGKVVLLVLSKMVDEKDHAEARQIADRLRIEVCPGTMFEIDTDEDDCLAVSYQNLSTQQYVRDTYDVVVLCSDVGPSEGLPELARLAEVELHQNGYIALPDADASDATTTRPGIFVAGCGSGPKNIKDSLATARAAASGALASLDQRLLREDTQAAPSETGADAVTPESQEETRVLIEKMLYSLLERR